MRIRHSSWLLRSGLVIGCAAFCLFLAGCGGGQTLVNADDYYAPGRNFAPSVSPIPPTQVQAGQPAPRVTCVPVEGGSQLRCFHGPVIANLANPQPTPRLLLVPQVRIGIYVPPICPSPFDVALGMPVPYACLYLYRPIRGYPRGYYRRRFR